MHASGTILTIENGLYDSVTYAYAMYMYTSLIVICLATKFILLLQTTPTSPITSVVMEYFLPLFSYQKRSDGGIGIYTLPNSGQVNC